MHKLKGKKQTAEHIKKRVDSARKKNFGWTDERRKRFGENNPMKNSETRDKMIKSKRVSPLVPRGDKHHAWKGGITPIHNRIRGSLEYIIWRNEVYKRDRWTCRMCKKYCEKGDIVAHHLQKFSDFPELRFLVENGLTFCRKCHVEVEKPYITHT